MTWFRCTCRTCGCPPVAHENDVVLFLLIPLKKYAFTFRFSFSTTAFVCIAITQLPHLMHLLIIPLPIPFPSWSNDASPRAKIFPYWLWNITSTDFCGDNCGICRRLVHLNGTYMDLGQEPTGKYRGPSLARCFAHTLIGSMLVLS